MPLARPFSWRISLKACLYDTSIRTVLAACTTSAALNHFWRELTIVGPALLLAPGATAGALSDALRFDDADAPSAGAWANCGNNCTSDLHELDSGHMAVDLLEFPKTGWVSPHQYNPAQTIALVHHTASERILIIKTPTCQLALLPKLVLVVVLTVVLDPLRLLNVGDRDLMDPQLPFTLPLVVVLPFVVVLCSAFPSSSCASILVVPSLWDQG